MAATVEGVGPGGEAVRVEVAGGEARVLVWLTSSCLGCREFWGRVGEVAGAAVVTPGPALEDRAKVGALAAGVAVPVVMSAEAWEDYGVTGSPFAVVVRDGRVAAEGPLGSWDELASLASR